MLIESICMSTLSIVVLRGAYIIFFFSIGFSLKNTDNSQDIRGRERTIFYSTLPLPPNHEYSGIYWQLFTWDDDHIFLIATLVFTRLLLDEISTLLKLLFDWLMWCWFCSFACWFYFKFCYSYLTWEHLVDSNPHQLSSLGYKRTD